MRGAEPHGLCPARCASATVRPDHALPAAISARVRREIDRSGGAHLHGHLLTPNLFSGGQRIHSVKAWISLHWMAEAVGVCLHLIEVWVEWSKTPCDTNAGLGVAVVMELTTHRCYGCKP